jgi:hypothetical protein
MGSGTSRKNLKKDIESWKGGNIITLRGNT